MPFGDGTGPLGYGPATGRRAGWCAGFTGPGYANNAVSRVGYGRGRGRGRGMGYGRGRGMGWWGPANGPVAIAPQNPAAVYGRPMEPGSSDMSRSESYYPPEEKNTDR